MIRDWKKFPELRNSEMATLYFESPHKQITESFSCDVVKVIDGDTIRVKWEDRDFDFPIRFLGTNAREMNEGGEKAKDWLEERIGGEGVDIIIDPDNRVGKFGRLLGKVFHMGSVINDEMIMLRLATTFEGRNEGKLPNLNKEFNIKKWL